MKYTRGDCTKDVPFLNHRASGKVVFSIKQPFEYVGQTQVEFLVVHPVYPASVGCDLASTAGETVCESGTFLLVIRRLIERKWEWDLVS